MSRIGFPNKSPTPSSRMHAGSMAALGTINYYNKPSAYFRGRAVLKNTVPFDSGIRGFKLTKIQTASHTEKVWSTEGTFDEMHVWSLTNKSRTKHEQSINDWFKLSAAIHGDPVQTEPVQPDKAMKSEVAESKESEEVTDDQQGQQGASNKVTDSKDAESSKTTNSKQSETTKSKESETASPSTTTTDSTETAVPEEIKKAVNALSLTDWEDNELKVKSIRFLEEHRLKIYGAKNKAISSAKHVLAVECVPDDDDEDEDEDSDQEDDEEDDVELTESIVVIDGEGKANVVE